MSAPLDDNGTGPAARERSKDALRQEAVLGRILGVSRSVNDLRDRIRHISSCEANVLITGESGTGKELVARAIHYLSARSSKPFIPVNCGAIPESLFENELFGHCGGAFTGAREAQAGLVKEAEGGTLFLDEIGAIAPYAQVKFLRLLQEREYKPLGEGKPRKADIRIIAATNRELSSLVKEGSFREDLYYRLNVACVTIPPLRERKEDIEVLARNFLERYSREYNRAGASLAPGVLEAFAEYPWPGNVRELENRIQQIILMQDGTENPFHVRGSENATRQEGSTPTSERIEPFKAAKKRVINSFEREYLTMLLREHSGDVARAARKAGKSRTALWNLLKKHNLSPKSVI